MNKQRVRSLALSAALSIASIGAASAAMINFSMNSSGNPTPTNQNLGSMYAFAGGVTASSGNVLTWSGTCADGVASSSSPCLIYKYTANDPSETGLGLTPLLNNEIGYPYGIALTTSSGYISGLELGSVQNGESWQVLGCTDGLSPAACSVLDSGIGSGTGGSTVNVSGLGDFSGYIVDVPCQNSISNCNPGQVPGALPDPGSTDSSNNILLMSVTTVSNVPEPGTLALFAAGLLGCLFFVRRRARQH